MEIKVKVKLIHPNDMLQKRIDHTNSCSYLFIYNTEESLEYIKELDTSNVITTRAMFEANWNLISAPMLDLSNVVNAYGMFNGCSKLITIPTYDTSKFENIERIFINCQKLETIPALNFSNVKNMKDAFYGCISLKYFLAYGMKVSFDISASTQFEASDLEIILNNLATVTETQTLTMGTTNLAKLTDEQKAIATSKGWVLA